MDYFYEGKYDIGTRPTAEEWEIYKRVFAYDQRRTVATWLEDEHPETTQELFEHMCDEYADMWPDDGGYDWNTLRYAYEYAVEDFEKRQE